MRRVIKIWVVAVVIGLCGLRMSNAQEATKSNSDDNKAKTERSEKPVHAYRVDFSINEMEGGKKINTRHYSMNLNSGKWTVVKVSSQVPVPSPQTPGRTLDVGTMINCELTESGEDVAVQVHGDFSNFFSADEQRPIIRLISIDGSTLATSGKSVVIGTVDDPNSNHQFELDATVTRLK